MKNIATILFMLLAVVGHAQTPNGIAPSGGAGGSGIADFTNPSSQQVDTLTITDIAGTEYKVVMPKAMVLANTAPVGTAIAKSWVDTLGSLDSFYFNNNGDWVLFGVAGGGGDEFQFKAAIGTGSSPGNYRPYGTPSDSLYWLSLYKGSIHMRKSPGSQAQQNDNGLNVYQGFQFVETDLDTLQFDCSLYNRAIINVEDVGTFVAIPSNYNSNPDGDIFMIAVKNNSASAPSKIDFDGNFYKTFNNDNMPSYNLPGGGSTRIFIFIQEYWGETVYWRCLNDVAGNDNLGDHIATEDLNMSGFDVLNIKPEVYGPGWNGDNSAPTKNDTYDKIEAVVASIPNVSNKVTKGGDTDGAALTVGTNDAFDLNLERNGTTEVTVKTGEVDFTNDNLTNVAALSATNAQLQGYTTYSTTGTNLANSMCHYVTALGATTTMTVTTANFGDKAIFFIKNLSSVNNIAVAAGSGLTSNGNMVIPPLATGWYQRVGSVVEALGGSGANEYMYSNSLATDANGVYTIAHPFGSQTIRFASLSITHETTPYIWTIKAVNSTAVLFQVWNPTTGLPIQLPNTPIKVLIKV